MFDSFNKEKSDFLKKKDKSKKGSIDKDAVKLVNLINSKNDFYTTSSCAGRIVLLEMKSSRKNECNWIFTKHDKVNFKEINGALNKYSISQKSKIFGNLEIPNEFQSKNNSNDGKNNNKNPNKIKNNKNTKNYEVWFKQQPLIFHIACNNLDSAKRFLEISRKMFRRAGIIGITERKVTLEIIGSEHLETIVKDKNFAVDEKYLKQLIKYANRNFAENKKKIEKFLNEVKKLR